MRLLAALLLSSATLAAAAGPNRLPPPLAEKPGLGVALSGGGPRGRAHLGVLQALHELSAFALFAATTTLPRDQELALSRDVSQRLKKIRL